MLIRRAIHVSARTVVLAFSAIGLEAMLRPGRLHGSVSRLPRSAAHAGGARVVEWWFPLRSRQTTSTETLIHQIIDSGYLTVDPAAHQPDRERRTDLSATTRLFRLAARKASCDEVACSAALFEALLPRSTITSW